MSRAYAASVSAAVDWTLGRPTGRVMMISVWNHGCIVDQFIDLLQENHSLLVCIIAAILAGMSADRSAEFSAMYLQM